MGRLVLRSAQALRRCVAPAARAATELTREPVGRSQSCVCCGTAQTLTAAAEIVDASLWATWGDASVAALRGAHCHERQMTRACGPPQRRACCGTASFPHRCGGDGGREPAGRVKRGECCGTAPIEPLRRETADARLRAAPATRVFRHRERPSPLRRRRRTRACGPRQARRVLWHRIDRAAAAGHG